MRLNEEQQAAVEAVAERFTVRAAAGSGKTSVLTARFLRHVQEDGLRPDQILTITFTRKAAAEMKSRIVRRLREVGRLEDAQAAETGPIQTIHSFCERLLRENALAAGIDPAFDIPDEATSRAMEAEAVRTALSRVSDEDPMVSALVTRMAGERRWRSANRLDSALSQDVIAILDRLRSSGLAVEELASAYRDADTTMAFWAQTILKSEDWPSDARDEARARPLDEWREPVGQALRAAKRQVPPWLKHEAHSLRSAAADTAGIVQLALAVWARLESEQIRLQTFDFGRMEAMAVQLVEESAAVRERLAHQYRAVLVDEAQDVNPLQYRLLQALSLPNEMMVGDPQQSIYGFRMADPGLFVGRTAATDCLALRTNFRSQPGILAFVDDLFGHFWGADYAPMLKPAAPLDLFTDASPPDYDGVELWTMSLPDSSAIATGVAQLISEGVSPGEIAVLIRRADSGQRIHDALTAHGVPTELVGGTERFFTRLEVRDLANALEAAADPTRDFALLAMLRSPFVGLSLDAIVDIAHRGQGMEAVRAHVPAVEGDAERIARFLEWFPALTAYADRVPAWEVLSALLRETDYLTEIARRPNGGQTVANVRKLLVMATQQPEKGALALADEIREIQSVRHREGDAPLYDTAADVVRIMTVHKAKGLEFPTVVVADTHQKPLKPNNLQVDARTGMVVVRSGGPQNPAHAWMAAAAADRDQAESLRLLYVAMTRAKQRLCVVTGPAGGGSGTLTHAGRLADRLLRRGTAPPGVRVRELGA